jgi:hypothetical protein
MYKDVVLAAEGAHALNAILEFMKLPYIHIAAGLRDGMEYEIWPENDEGWKQDYSAAVANIDPRRTTQAIPRPQKFQAARAMAAQFGEEFHEKVTRKDMVRIPYYIYVDEWKKGDALQNFLMEHVMPVLSFGIGAAVAGATQTAHVQWDKLFGELPSKLGDLTKSEACEVIMGAAEFLKSSLEAGENVHDLFFKDKSDKFGIWKAAASKRIKILMTTHELCGKTPVAEHKHSHPLPFFATEIASAFVRGHW